MKTKLTTLLLATVLCSSTAYAQRSGTNYNYNYGERPSFNYLELGYAWQDVESANINGETFDCDQDGVALVGSIMLNEQIFLRADHENLSGTGCRWETTSLGIGLRHDFGRASSLYGLAHLLYRDYGADKDPGIGLSAGVRSTIATGVELEGYLGFETIDEIDETYVGGGVNYSITQELSLIGRLNVNDEGHEGYSLGIRLSF